MTTELGIGEGKMKERKQDDLVSKTHVGADNMSLQDLTGPTAGEQTCSLIMHATYTGAVWLDDFSTVGIQQYVLLNGLTFNGI